MLDHRLGGQPGSRGEARAPLAGGWEFGSLSAGQHQHPAGGNGRHEAQEGYAHSVPFWELQGCIVTVA